MLFFIFCNKLFFFLYIQLNGLNTLCGQLSRVQNPHSVMSKALDTTRHELQFKDVFKPEEGKEYYVCTIYYLVYSPQEFVIPYTKVCLHSQ